MISILHCIGNVSTIVTATFGAINMILMLVGAIVGATNKSVGSSKLLYYDNIRFLWNVLLVYCSRHEDESEECGLTKEFGKCP